MYRVACQSSADFCCIADFQSAGAADWKSAIQQVGNLRYDATGKQPDKHEINLGAPKKRRKAIAALPAIHAKPRCERRFVLGPRDRNLQRIESEVREKICHEQELIRNLSAFPRRQVANVPCREELSCQYQKSIADRGRLVHLESGRITVCATRALWQREQDRSDFWRSTRGSQCRT